MSIDVLNGLTPTDLGINYEQYRHIQLEAMEAALYGDSPIVGLGLPPGAGKSLTAVSIARMIQQEGGRTAILTSTKGLQDQYQRDFKGLIADIRGQANYTCARARNCEDGLAMGCACGVDGSYQLAYRNALQKSIVVTNYSYWFSNRGGLGELDRLILDEAVQAPKELARAVSIVLTEVDLNRMRVVTMPPTKAKIQDWTAWTDGMIPLAKAAILDLSRRHLTPAGIDRFRRWKRFEDKMRRFPAPDEIHNWVFEYKTGTPMGREWNWSPVDVSSYVGMLTRNIPRIVLMSATLKKRTLLELGLQGTFKEWDRVFPPERSPIYLVPPRMNGKAVRIDRRTTDEALSVWVEHIDRIIEGRLDRKGLIHTVSYARQKFLLEHSHHARLMIANTSDPDSETASESADRFRRAIPPSILVSPSFGVGWDFPGEECRYVIIGKVPFPSSESAWMKARVRKDPDYLNAEALQQLVQSAMRGMRSGEDWCEVFIADDHLRWLLPQNRELVPRWFQSGVYNVKAIPRPLNYA